MTEREIAAASNFIIHTHTRFVGLTLISHNRNSVDNLRFNRKLETSLIKKNIIECLVIIYVKNQILIDNSWSNLQTDSQLQ